MCMYVCNCVCAYVLRACMCVHMCVCVCVFRYFKERGYMKLLHLNFMDRLMHKVRGCGLIYGGVV